MPLLSKCYENLYLRLFRELQFTNPFAISLRLIAVVSILSAFPHLVIAQLTGLGVFNPEGNNFLCGVGFDEGTGNVWTIACTNDVVTEFTNSIEFVSDFTIPFETDSFHIDLDFAPEPLTLGSTPIPANSLLVITSWPGPMMIHALDKSTGTSITSLATSIPANGGVGGAYHPGRNTFFLAVDEDEGPVYGSLIYEVDPQTGATLNSFSLRDSGMVLNHGDVDVSTATGNLFIVGVSDTTIAEFTPDGTFVQELQLPLGMNSLTGIALDDVNGEAWITEYEERIWRIGGFPAVPEPTSAVLAVIGVVSVLARRRPSR